MPTTVLTEEVNVTDKIQNDFNESGRAKDYILMSNMNLREESSTESNIIQVMKKGEEFQILDQYKCNDLTCWYFIKIKSGLTGWFCGVYHGNVMFREKKPPAHEPAKDCFLTSNESQREESSMGSDIIQVMKKEEGSQIKKLENLIMDCDLGIKSARQKLAAARSQLYETQSLFGPEVNSQYSYYPEGGGLGEEEIYTEHWFSMRVTQDIVQLLKIKPGIVKGMEAEVEAAEAELKEAERKALFELRQEYLEILTEKIQAELYLQIKEIYQKLFEIQKKRYLYKEILLGDVLKTEMDLIKTKDSFLYHQSGFESKKKFLAKRLGIDVNEMEIEKLEFNLALPSYEQLIYAAHKNRGEIKVYKAKARQENAKATGSAYEHMRLSPYLGYQLREDRVTGSESGPVLGLAFSIPLCFKNIKNNRDDVFRAKERYCELQAKKISQDIEKDIRKAYEKYLLENSRLLSAEKNIELRVEEIRIERSRLENPLGTVKADQANLLRIEADYAKANLEKNIAKSERDKTCYELLYLSGFSWPEELLSYFFKDEDFRRKPYPRALWVWDVKEFLENEQAGEFFVSFCKTKNIKRVFFSLNKQLLDSLPQNPNLSKFIAKLDEAGINISALFGENLWVYPRYRKNLISYIELVIAYNSINPSGTRFDGIHLDIEPHALKEWDSEQEKLLSMLVETVVAVKETISASKAELQLEIDIPTFYDLVAPSMLQKLIEAADIITVMAYERRNPDKVIESVKKELEAAVEANKGIIVGLNAKDFSEEAKLEELIAEVGNTISATPSFLGFSIHDFNDYRMLAGR